LERNKRNKKLPFSGAIVVCFPDLVQSSDLGLGSTLSLRLQIKTKKNKIKQ
jgi:hypothetical protein